MNIVNGKMEITSPVEEINVAFIKDTLQNMLRTNTATVTFTKKSGEERIIRCSLKPDLIEPYIKKTDRVKESPDHLVSVWDIDNGGWRSINIDTIKTLEIEE